MIQLLKKHIMLHRFASALICSAALMLVVAACGSLKSSGTNTELPEEKLGWKLGAQAYTFRMFSFFEAVDKIDSCGLRYVESYPTQPIGGDVKGKMDFRMDEATKQLVRKKLKEKNVTLYAYGVVKLKTDKEWQQLFDFCKSMGIQTITAEPDKKFIPLLSELCDKYEINLAIHNHPKPSFYWGPDVVLETISGHSKRIGACADVGHWVRSGLDPIESLKKLEGRIFHLHMKDMNEKNNRKAHDVHWGNGVSDIKGIVAELKRQNFKGMISAEYEYNWYNNVPDVTASVKYFRSLID